MDKVLIGHFDEKIEFFNEHFQLKILMGKSGKELVRMFFDDKNSSQDTLISFLQTSDDSNQFKNDAINFGILKLDYEDNFFQKVDPLGVYIDDRDDNLLETDARKILAKLCDFDRFIKELIVRKKGPNETSIKEWLRTESGIREYFSFCYPTQILPSFLDSIFQEYVYSMYQFDLNDKGIENIHKFHYLCQIEKCNLFDLYYEYKYLPRNERIIIDCTQEISTNDKFIDVLRKGSIDFSNLQLYKEIFTKKRELKTLVLLFQSSKDKTVYFSNKNRVFMSSKLVDFKQNRKETILKLSDVKDISYNLHKPTNDFINFDKESFDYLFQQLDQNGLNTSKILRKLATFQYLKELSIAKRDVCQVDKSHKLEEVTAKVLYLNRTNIEDIQLRVLFCNACQQYQINQFSLLEQLRYYGYSINDLIIDIRGNNSDFDTNGFQEQSILYKLGYTVRQNDFTPRSIRRSILNGVIRLGIWDYEKVKSHLITQINLKSSNSIYSNAVNEWQSDLDFLYFHESSLLKKADHKLFYSSKLGAKP